MRNISVEYFKLDQWPLSRALMALFRRSGTISVIMIGGTMMNISVELY